MSDEINKIIQEFRRKYGYSGKSWKVMDKKTEVTKVTESNTPTFTEKHVLNHSHLCIDEIASGIKSSLEVIEKLWNSLNLNCNFLDLREELQNLDEKLDGIKINLIETLQSLI